jgi:hypothetical protein
LCERPFQKLNRRDVCRGKPAGGDGEDEEVHEIGATPRSTLRLLLRLSGRALALPFTQDWPDPSAHAWRPRPSSRVENRVCGAEDSRVVVCVIGGTHAASLSRPRTACRWHSEHQEERPSDTLSFRLNSAADFSALQCEHSFFGSVPRFSDLFWPLTTRDGDRPG